MRGRAWTFVGAAGVALALLGEVDALSPVAAAALTVLSSVALALLAHGGPTLGTEAVAFGASGALAYEALRPYMPLVASGLLLTFVFGTRAMRSRTVRELVFHLAAAFGGGAAAAWVTRAHDGLETTLWMVAVVVAALLASVPWLVPADAPRTFALRRLASRARGPLRARLLRAVIAHRTLADLELPKRLRARIELAFDHVRVEAERRLERRAVDRVDGALAARVDQLVRVARAARAKEAMLEGLDDVTAQLAADGDALEAEVAALGEVA